MRYKDLVNSGFNHGIFDMDLIPTSVWKSYLSEADFDEVWEYQTFEVFINPKNHSLELFLGEVDKESEDYKSFPWDIFMLDYVGEFARDGVEKLVREMLKLMDMKEYLI